MLNDQFEQVVSLNIEHSSLSIVSFEPISVGICGT